jgi:transposase
MPIHIGLDWGNASHAVCAVDEQGSIQLRFEAMHDHAGLTDLVRRLTKLGPPQELPIALERPSGLLVDTLINAGFVVVPIHPNVVKACRSRYSAVHAKTDGTDAYLLADLLRTDGHRFPPLRPESDAVRALRALCRTRDDLVAERTAIANQLRALLDSFWPGAAAVFSEITSPIALAFVQRYPTPQSAAHLGEKRLASFLAQHRYSGRRPVTELLERLRDAPASHVGPLEAEAKGELVRSLSLVLERLGEQIAAITSRIEHDLLATEDGPWLTSFPRIGRLNAAQIYAELGSVRERFPTVDALAAEAGACPVTRQSGKSHSVAFRWACNTRLRVALTTFADNSRHASPWAADVYQRARARGAKHPHAIRILARAWLKVLWRCWVERIAYDPIKHRAALPFLIPAAHGG